MAAKLKIPVLPLPAWTEPGEAGLLATSSRDPFAGDGMSSQFFGPSGRWLLAATLASLGIRREQEIAILTTSQEAYVSTCVSVTAFNFARISRIVTPDTAVVVLIHEFGYVAEDFATRIAAWQENGLTVIEDCAHIMGITVGGAPVGGCGDFALYSLPKLIPIERGGLLRARRAISLSAFSLVEQEATTLAMAAASKYLPKIDWFNRRRRENTALIERLLSSRMRPFRPSLHGVPWLVGFLSPERAGIVAESPEVEWGATLHTDLLYVSTNPFVTPEVYEDLLTRPCFS